MAEKAMIEYAYEIMQQEKKESLPFATLWKLVSKKAELTKEDADKKVANFYTQLSLDGRFVASRGNKWSLRDRLKFNSAHIDLNEYYKDLESGSEDDDNEEEQQSSKDENSLNDEEINENL